MKRKLIFTSAAVFFLVLVAVFVSAVGSSCNHMGDCSHLNDERGAGSNYIDDNYWDDWQDTFGQGVTLQAKHGECSGIADPEGTTDATGSCVEVGWYDVNYCPNFNNQYCVNDTSYHDPYSIESAPQELGYYEFWAVNNNCCEPLQREKMDCRDPHDPNADNHGGGGNRSYCKIQSSEAICDSFPITSNLNAYISSKNFGPTSPEGLTPEDYFNLEHDSLTAHFEWEYDSQTDESFQISDIQVRSGNSDFSSGNIVDTSLSSLNYTMSTHLEYDTTYYWRVQTWDNTNRSGWHQDSFQTQARRASVDFVWYPSKPFEAETTYFIDRTEDHGTNIIDWQWEFGSAANPSTASGSPIATTTYQNVDSPQTVTLTVTDADGYQGSMTKTIEPRPSLPDWQEIDPF